MNPRQNVPWGPRVLHHTVVFQKRIWIIGGQTLPGFVPSKETFYRDIWNSTDGSTGEQIDPVEPYWLARGMIGGQAVFHDRIWILGGGTYDTPATPKRNFYNDVWSSADGRNWTLDVATAPWPPRQYHDVAVFDNRLWVLEGYSRPGGNRTTCGIPRMARTGTKFRIRLGKRVTHHRLRSSERPMGRGG